jgi:hypothetical protein
MIEIEGGIEIGGGIIIGDAPILIYFITEDSNFLVSQTDEYFIEEQL